jgi:hypothetical protein
MEQVLLEFTSAEGDKFEFIISEQGHVLSEKRLFSNGDRFSVTYLIETLRGYYYVKEESRQTFIGGINTRKQRYVSLMDNGYIERTGESIDGRPTIYHSKQVEGIPPLAQLYQHSRCRFPQFTSRGNFDMGDNIFNIVHANFQVIKF